MASSVGTSSTKPAWDETEQEARARFVAELEFVQCLSNVGYLAHLAATRQLFAPEFVAYLKYLQYWKQPQYARFLQWPHCLQFLDLLQDEAVREKLYMDPEYPLLLMRQFENHWRFRNKAK